MAALRALGNFLILGLVHHVGWYEPILPGQQPQQDLTLDPGLVVGESQAMKRVIEELRAAVDPAVHVLLRGVLWLGGAALLWDLSLLAGGGLDEEGWRIHPVRLGLALAALIGAVALAAMPAEGRPGEIAHGLGLMALGASVLIVRWTQLLSRSPAVVGCFIAAWLLCRWGLAVLSRRTCACPRGRFRGCDR